MMSIAEFVLSRVAEDEAVAEGAGSFTPWDRTFDRDNYGCLLIQPARVLAQCKAHRAIVELADDATGLDMSVDNDRLVGRRDEVQEPYLGDIILRALAAIWSDHKDWREDWSAQVR